MPSESTEIYLCEADVSHGPSIIFSSNSNRHYRNHLERCAYARQPLQCTCSTLPLTVYPSEITRFA